MNGLGMQELIVFVAIFGVILLPGIVGAIISKNKGRSKIAWFVFCAIFPLFVIILLFLKPAKEVEGKIKQCPKCQEFIKWKAIVCRYCSSTI